MIAAWLPIQRPADARILAADARGELWHLARQDFVSLLRKGDLVVANDAATLPASLAGRHAPSGAAIEVRLAGAHSLAIGEEARFTAIVFGEGDHRTRTEDRPAPPALTVGDRLELGPATALIERLLGHPRLIELRFEGPGRDVWNAIAHHGRPIQYAHVPQPLAMWDVWTPIAGAPLAFEPPSAGFVLDWAALSSMRQRGIGFATITLAAGISSTGDPALDRRLPLDEPYRIPETTAGAIRRAKAAGSRVIAIGTTVVRALESAATADGRVSAGEAVARLKIDASHRLRVADSIISGTHEPGTSHYELLRAFAGEETLEDMNAQLQANGYRTHEFGDSIFVERAAAAARWRPSRGERMLGAL